MIREVCHVQHAVRLCVCWLHAKAINAVELAGVGASSSANFPDVGASNGVEHLHPIVPIVTNKQQRSPTRERLMVQPGMMMQPIAQAGLMMMAPAPMYSADPFAPLVNMDMLIVDQQYDVLEAITGIEGKNKYKIYTRHGLKYFAQEESEPCARCCLGPHVGLTVYYRSIDKNGPEVLRLEKPFMCCCPVLLPCCQKEATLKINNGMDTVAYFQQPMFGGCFTPTIDIYDRQGGSKIGYMTGPCCCVGGFFDDKFEVFDATGSSVAKFQRMGASDVGDVAKFLTSDADRFGIHFDPTLDLKLKSLVLGIVIFLDYLYFEVILLCAVHLFLLIRNVCHLERWTLQT
jgi:hypothetical protein